MAEKGEPGLSGQGGQAGPGLTAWFLDVPWGRKRVSACTDYYRVKALDGGEIHLHAKILEFLFF